jgi:hypothetical protein
MTSIAPSGPFQTPLPQQQQQQQQQTQPQQPPQPPQGQSEISTLSWEGDKMCVLLPSLLLVMNNLDNRFNIYIYDYCFKRGYRKTARELLAEAEIPPESMPPINARQGLLFECVFFSFLHHHHHHRFFNLFSFSLCVLFYMLILISQQVVECILGSFPGEIQHGWVGGWAALYPGTWPRSDIDIVFFTMLNRNESISWCKTRQGKAGLANHH